MSRQAGWLAGIRQVWDLPHLILNTNDDTVLFRSPELANPGGSAHHIARRKRPASGAVASGPANVHGWLAFSVT